MLVEGQTSILQRERIESGISKEEEGTQGISRIPIQFVPSMFVIRACERRDQTIFKRTIHLYSSVIRYLLVLTLRL